MITMDELLRGAKLNEQDPDVQNNLLTLLNKLNQLRTAYGQPMTISSGLRTKADQIRIYKEKMGVNFNINKVPMGSQHIAGAAADIYDPKGIFQKWVLLNLQLFDTLDLFMEDFSATPTWVHIQLYPFKSYSPGKTRFFKP